MDKAAQYFYPFEMEFCLSAVGLLAGLIKRGEIEFLNIENRIMCLKTLQFMITFSAVHILQNCFTKP